LYPASEAFLTAVKANTRKYYWTGRITTTAGTVYNFDQDDMVKDSGYITSQCCGSTEIELGTVYAAERAVKVSFLVKISISDLNIRSGPGRNFKRVRFIEPGVFTIVQTSSGAGASMWGKLKSGIGWISLDFVRRI